MTFCLGITVDEGLVAISDTRLVAGNECLVGRKTATYQGPGFAFFTMNSGLRSLRDKVLLYFEEAFARESANRDRLYRVVNLYAQQVRRVAQEDAESLERAELTFNMFSLIGGQMSGDSAHRLFLVYPEGNWVEIGPDTPYQIIGASGFGKPILERSLTRSFRLVEQRYKMDDLREISHWWQERMRRAVQDLPSSWVETAFSKLTRNELVL
jgi:putative proteasome-type protease